MISAEVVAHSRSLVTGTELITMKLTYPRFIHSEFLTHRQFSRNSSSSRAVPVQKFLESMSRNLAEPIHWGRAQKGMVAEHELDDKAAKKARNIWKAAALSASAHARELLNLGAHKQVANRIIEPFCHIETVVTATEWQNFYDLRDHPAAQPEIAALASAMKQAVKVSKPRELQPGEWHLPWIQESEAHKLPLELQIACSVARCARVSYLNHTGQKPDIAADVSLYWRLMSAEPPHASPAEHQGTPMTQPGFSGPLRDWNQFRKLHEKYSKTQLAG